MWKQCLTWKNIGLIVIGLSGFSVSTAQADNLCPDTSKMGDLKLTNGSDLQFDIDRLALCLQRAKLLQQIDETVKKREEIRQVPLGQVGSSNTSGVNNAFPSIPSMPALPDLGAPPPAIPRIMPVPDLPAATVDWKIQRIWGQGSDMQAQLAKDDMIANVKLNDTLPTGEKVSELSGRGVTLNDGKTAHSLKWLETVKKTGTATRSRT